MTTPSSSRPQGAPIVVVGSANVDLVVRAARLPLPGETIAGEAFETVNGGKGANQAVAAARLGAAVAMVGCVGDDAHGAAMREALAADGIDIGALAVAAGVPTGIAAITVGADGANSIVVVPGANARVDLAQVDAAAWRLAAAAMLVCQFEVPLASVAHAIARAAAAGTPVLLNPAPAMAFDTALLRHVDYLVVNESEAEALSGVAVADAATAFAAADALRVLGARNVIVTLGAQGVCWRGDAGEGTSGAVRVTAVDTTAAGDTFIGGFVAARTAGATMAEAIDFGQHAAALGVTRHGAQTSIPTRDEVVQARAARQDS